MLRGWLIFADGVVRGLGGECDDGTAGGPHKKVMMMMRRLADLKGRGYGGWGPESCWL